MLARGFTRAGSRPHGEPAPHRQALPSRRVRPLAAGARSLPPSRRRCASSPRDKPTTVTLVNNAAVAHAHRPRRQARRRRNRVRAFATNAAAPVVMADLFFRSFPTIRSSGGSSTCRPARRRRRSPARWSTACRRRRSRCSPARSWPNAARRAFAASRCGRASSKPECRRTCARAIPPEFPSVALFRGFKENGLLKDPADVAARIVDKLVLAPVEHGRTYSHTDF